MHWMVLMIGMALQAPAGSAPSASKVAVYSDCDASSEVIAQIPRESALDIHYSIAEASTCYYASVTIDGKPVLGFVLDRQMPAIVAFEQARVVNETEAFKAPLPLPPSETPAVKPEPEKTAATKALEEKKPVAKPRRNVSM